MNDIPLRILQLAHALMPLEQRQWAAAMQAEYQHVDTNRLSFALGCLGSAVLANLVNPARIFQLSLGLLALVLLGLSAYGLGIITAKFVGESQKTLGIVAANLFLVLICLIGGAGAMLAAYQDRNLSRMAHICAGTVACVTLATGTAWFLTLGILNIWKNQEQLPLLAPLWLASALFSFVGWVGFSGPRRLRDAGLIGMSAAMISIIASTSIGSTLGNWAGFGQMTFVLMAMVALSGTFLSFLDAHPKQKVT